MNNIFNQSNFMELTNNVLDTANNVISNIPQTMNNVISNIPQTMNNVVASITNNTNINTNEKKDDIKLTITEQQKVETDELFEYEKKIESGFKGCYLDNPTEPSMNTFLGYVSNSLECIEKGKEKGYKYIGIQQGNKCFASNEIPKTEKVNRKECNILCDDPETGRCGGYYYNQVYDVVLEKTIPEEIRRVIDNFTSLENDSEKITSKIKCNLCSEPINNYNLFISLVIIVILIFLLIQYLNKKENIK